MECVCVKERLLQGGASGDNSTHRALQGLGGCRVNKQRFVVFFWVGPVGEGGYSMRDVCAMLMCPNVSGTGSLVPDSFCELSGRYKF